MPKQNQSSEKPRKRMPPGKTPEARTSQLIAYAYNLVEERLLNGTASSQETTLFLKEGTARAKLELEILEKQKELMAAKTEALQSQKRVEELFGTAMAAFKMYAGLQTNDDDEGSNYD